MVSARPSTQLLERDHEIELLQRAWRGARAGHGSAWFLCAEAGGGKSRLAAEFMRAAGGRTLWGAAEPLVPPDPYLAVIRAIPGFAPAPTRAGSVAGALTALEQAASPSPVIVVLDDLHFADEGTIAVTARLAAACASQPWLILATFRPGEGPPGLLAPLVEAVAQGTAHRLDLALLSREAVGTLVAAVRGRPPDAGELDAIYAGSGGNPWFAEALARGNGAVSTARDRMSLRLDRIEQATPGALRVLQALAPASRPLPHEVLADLSGGDSRELRRVLTALRDAGVVRDDTGAWGFRHDLLRRALLDAMIAPDRRDAHRALAEALERHADSAGRRATAAELAMQYAAAGDRRAVEWALAAARAASAVDAHGEAMAQIERALAFDLEPEQRRSTLQAAAAEAYALGRFVDNRRLAEEALAIPGGEPETLARLHQFAARAAYQQGDLTADEAHLAAAERALAGRPITMQTANIAVARVARAALAIDPERLAETAERARLIGRALDHPDRAAWVDVVVRRYLAVSRIECGDPSGFTMIEDLLRDAAEHRLSADTAANALVGAYQEAVVAWCHDQAPGLRERLSEAIERHDLGWMGWVEPYHVLELVQRGSYDAARALASSISPPAAGTLERVVLVCATVLREARAGAPERARAALEAVAPGRAYQQGALYDLARLELAMLEAAPGLGELAQRVYGAANRRRYVRVAGVAAVGLARSRRGAPEPPGWLVPDAPLRVLWQWAAAIERRDSTALRAVAGRLDEMMCPYEAALALHDAGDDAEAYRALRALGATTLRERLAERLRAAAQRIPRRTRSALQPGGLTETERQVCRLVATGASNEEIASALTISIRTVETHLTHIYQKIGRRGRAALIAWWTQQPSGPVSAGP